MKRTLSLVGAFVLVAAFAATAAFASVTFDSTSGTGFVGKGDIQIPLGWNNQTLQQNAGGVSFYTESDSDYAVTCEFDTGRGTHIVHHTINTRVNDQVTFDVSSASRKNPQGNVNGFKLLGFGASTETGPGVPSVGDACPGDSNQGLVTAVDPISSSNELFANAGGTDIPLLSY